MVAEARSSFYWPMQCMNAPKREAMRALYAFCRAVDDVADGTLPVTEKHRQLEEWRAEIAQLFMGTPSHSITVALRQTMLASPDNQAYFLGIIDGVAMDMDGGMVRPPLERLMRYCYGVAGCVGMLSLTIMGVDRNKFAGFAEALGRALQLTNILRDIEVDAAIGRIYLPQEWLQEAGLGSITPQMIVSRSVELTSVQTKLSDMAKRYYDYVHVHGMTRAERWRLLPALLMCDVYERTWQKLRNEKQKALKNNKIGARDQLALLAQLMSHMLKCLLPAGSVQSHKADFPLPARLHP